jgi:hypothetical protein
MLNQARLYRSSEQLIVVEKLSLRRLRAACSHKKKGRSMTGFRDSELTPLTRLAEAPEGVGEAAAKAVRRGNATRAANRPPRDRRYQGRCPCG